MKLNELVKRPAVRACFSKLVRDIVSMGIIEIAAEGLDDDEQGAVVTLFAAGLLESLREEDGTSPAAALQAFAEFKAAA